MQSIDSGTPADTAGCFGSFVPVCFSVIPAALVALTDDTDIDTDVSPICNQQNDHSTHYCIVAGAGFTSTKKITAHGSKPLVLSSTTTIVIAGEIDVSTKHNGAQPRGAGANPLSCTGAIDATGSSGAWGASDRREGRQWRTGRWNEWNWSTRVDGFPTLHRGGCPAGVGSPSAAGGWAEAAAARWRSSQPRFGSMVKSTLPALWAEEVQRPRVEAVAEVQAG